MNIRRLFKEPGIILLLYLVVVLSYYTVFEQYWFLKLTNGYLIKVWIPNLLIISVVFIKYEVIDKRHRPPFTIKRDYAYPLYVILFVLAVWDLIALYGHNQGAWYIGKYGLVSFSPVLLCVAIIILARNDMIIQRILFLIFLFGIVNVLDVELRYLSGDDYTDPLTMSTGLQIGGYGESSKISLSNAEDLIRHGKVAIGVNTYASWLMALPIVGYYFGKKSSNYILKCFYYLSAIFIFYAVLAAMTRAAILALFAGMIVFFFLDIFRSSKVKALRSILVVFVIIGIVISYNPGATIRFLILAFSTPAGLDSTYIEDRLFKYGMSQTHIDMSRSSKDPHLQRFGRSLSLLKDSPIIGVGWSRQYSVNEHNWFLQQLVIYGVLSFLISTMYFLSMIYKIWKVLKKSLYLKYSNSSLGILLFSCVIASLVYLNASPGINMNFWIIFGLAIAWARNTYEIQHADMRT